MQRIFNDLVINSGTYLVWCLGAFLILLAFMLYLIDNIKVCIKIIEEDPLSIATNRKLVIANALVAIIALIVNILVIVLGVINIILLVLFVVKLIG